MHKVVLQESVVTVLNFCPHCWVSPRSIFFFFFFFFFLPIGLPIWLCQSCVWICPCPQSVPMHCHGLCLSFCFMSISYLLCPLPLWVMSLNFKTSVRPLPPVSGTWEILLEISVLYFGMGQRLGDYYCTAGGSLALAMVWCFFVVGRCLGVRFWLHVLWKKIIGVGKKDKIVGWWRKLMPSVKLLGAFWCGPLPEAK